MHPHFIMMYGCVLIDQLYLLRMSHITLYLAIFYFQNLHFQISKCVLLMVVTVTF